MSFLLQGHAKENTIKVSFISLSRDDEVSKFEGLWSGRSCDLYLTGNEVERCIYFNRSVFVTMWVDKSQS